MNSSGRVSFHMCLSQLGRLVVACLLGAKLVGLVPIAAQEPVEGMVRLDLGEEVELKVLLDTVSRELGIGILYDASKLPKEKVFLRAPQEIPRSSLLTLLQSSLYVRGLLLADAGTPGWLKLVDVSQLADAAHPGPAGGPLEKFQGAGAATQVFEVRHARPSELETLIRGFVTTGGNHVALDRQRLLIVTDYVLNLERIRDLIERIDRPLPGQRMEFVAVRHIRADELARQLAPIIEARFRAAPATAAGGQAAKSVEVFPDERGNQLVVVGESAEVDEVLKLAERFDVSLGMTTQVYAIRNLTAERVLRLMNRLIDPAGQQRAFQSSVDAEENLIVVQASPAVHTEIDRIVKQLDVPNAGTASSRIRFFPLKHVTATEALETIRSLEEGTLTPAEERPLPTDGRFRLLNPERPPAGPNAPQLAPVENLPAPPVLRQPPQADAQFPIAPDTGEATVGSGSLGDAQVTADLHSNTLIVVGGPAAQQVYAELIEAIDKPRPQVLIEAKIVVLDTTDNFSLGVEVSGGDRTGARRLLGFSSFGLSTVNAVSGSLALIPGTGFNGTLVDPEVADVVLKAFSEHRRAKVISAPRLLVNDNATGLLTSVTEVPFTSVNASQTVSTTSFAGFAEAGTTVQVTPHISDDKQLKLEYAITLNEFQGAATATGIPPPRQTNEIQSIVTIPDGHTLIVGGLNRTSYSDDFDGIPFLESVPIIRRLSSSESEGLRKTSLFIFLKPVILRDDKFRDLKYYSERDLQWADLAQDHPQSLPLLVR